MRFFLSYFHCRISPPEFDFFRAFFNRIAALIVEIVDLTSCYSMYFDIPMFSASSHFVSRFHAHPRYQQPVQLPRAGIPLCLRSTRAPSFFATGRFNAQCRLPHHFPHAKPFVLVSTSPSSTTTPFDVRVCLRVGVRQCYMINNEIGYRSIWGERENRIIPE